MNAEMATQVNFCWFFNVFFCLACNTVPENWPEIRSYLLNPSAITSGRPRHGRLLKSLAPTSIATSSLALPEIVYPGNYCGNLFKVSFITEGIMVL